MSEEEKKAIEQLEYFSINKMLVIEKGEKSISDNINIVLNLIEKLKKEIEYDKTHILTPLTVKLNYIPIKNVLDMLDELDDRRDKGHITGYYSKREMLKKLLKQVNFDYKKYKEERGNK